MNYSLYRKYRPRNFDGVVGQDSIVRTLINQIAAGRLCHAYLFCGSRGVGKTSLARIFARAINCQNPEKNSLLPCGNCPSCLSSAQSNSIDIIEIDAASNNGVDDARSLRESVKYLPSSGSYKVYIIDEVHMLSGAAFNALLKTLEEPPAHALFILATTEAHKLPATVLSRCVRFDFRLVAPSQITALLARIFDAEKKGYEEEALKMIASAAEGSVRDALSLADMCFNLSDSTLTAAEVQSILGNDEEKFESLITAIAASDIRNSLLIINEMANSGMSLTIAAKQIATTCRDILALKLDESLVDFTLSKHRRLKNMAENLSASFLAGLIEHFIEAENTLKYALSPRLSIESAVISACKLHMLNLGAIEERLSRLEKDGYTPQHTPQKNEELAEEIVPEMPPITEERREINPAKIWGKLITFFRKNSTPKMFQVVSSHDPNNIRLSDDTLIICANKENFLFFCDDSFKEEIERAFLSENLPLKLVVEKDQTQVDMEKEAESLINEFGQKVNIIS